MKILQIEWTIKGFNQELDSNFSKTWDSPETLVLVFFSPGLVESGLWSELTRLFPRSCVTGCSGAGEVAGDRLEDHKAVITLCRFQKGRIKLITQKIDAIDDSFNCGKKLAETFPRDDLVGLYLISEGLLVNGTDLIGGVYAGLPDQVPVAGGLAGDGPHFKKTFVLGPQGPTSGLVAAVGFYGPALTFSCAAEGGWIPFGPPRKITRSHANVLYEIDGKPALQLYREYLGKQAENLPASGLLFPMQLETQGLVNRQVVRTLLAIDEAEQSMTFAGDMPQGASARLMQVGINNLIHAAKTAGEQCAALSHAETPVLSLVVSCVGRRLVMGEKTEDELEVIAGLLPAASVQAGFYSYGEIAPGRQGLSELHNQTMTLTWISEKV